MHASTLYVTDTAGRSLLRPVTSGIPLPAGVAPDGAAYTLVDDAGAPVPAQCRVLARWQDGSARWVLVDFQAAPPPGGRLRYELLTAPAGAAARLPAQPAAADDGGLRMGAMRVSRAVGSLLDIAGRLRLEMIAEDAAGKQFRAVAGETVVETAGPVRATLALSGSFRDDGGRRWFDFRLRVTLFAGLSRVLLEPMVLVDADAGLVQHLRALSIRLLPADGMTAAVLGGDPGWQGEAGRQARMLQVDDRHYTVADADGDRAPGWAEWSDGRGIVAVALRDFWQQWPKSLEVDDAAVTVGLLPRFTAGTFAHMHPWYKHDYLFDGDCYRLRTGQARRWQLWLALDGDGETLAACANAPLAAAADPEQALATGAWGRLAPAGTPALADYDAWVERLFDGYCRAIETERDYGAMNWGDWWGERGCNWGNHEYDTPRQILQQYARTGDPKYLRAGETAARHTAEVDVIHAFNPDLVRYFEEDLPVHMPAYPYRPGMVHEHCVGHVGGFHPVADIRALLVSLNVGQSDNPYLCLDPYNLGHIWTEGMMYAWFLTGDPWLRETLERIGDNLARLVEDREFRYFAGDSHSGRVNGWTMLALAGVYELDFDDRYLRAMRLLADDALNEQDPHCGGWLYELPWGHCFCTSRKHVGEAGFITAVRLNGLSRYYDLTGDTRVPDALRRAVTHLNNDTWRDDRADWRYTSCPASQMIEQQGVIILALANCVRITGDQDALRILRKAWAAKFARLQQTALAGKAFSAGVYGCPEAVSWMANAAESV